MPSYFHSTCQSAMVAQRGGGSACSWMRQEERIGLAAAQLVLVVRLRRDQLQEAGSAVGPHAAVGPAHQALRDQLGCRRRRSSPARASPAACDTPTRKPPPISLISRKRSRQCRVHPSSANSAARMVSGVGAAQRHDALVHPFRQADIAVAGRAAAGCGRWSRPGRRPRDSTRRTASRPAPRVLDRILAQQLGRHRLARLAAGQEVHGPGGVLPGAALAK